MNSDPERFRPFGLRQSLRGLALLLLSGIGPECPETRPDRVWHRGVCPLAGKLQAKDVPYLPALGPPALIFREPEPAAAPALRPAAVGSPVPGRNVVDHAVAAAHAAASLGPLNPAPAPALQADMAKPAALTSEAASTSPAKAPAQPIIRDDVKPPVHPEDFLPYFQVPGNPVPPSAAAYTQTPK